MINGDHAWYILSNRTSRIQFGPVFSRFWGQNDQKHEDFATFWFFTGNLWCTWSEKNSPLSWPSWLGGLLAMGTTGKYMVEKNSGRSWWVMAMPSHTWRTCPSRPPEIQLNTKAVLQNLFNGDQGWQILTNPTSLIRSDQFFCRFPGQNAQNHQVFGSKVF